VTSALDYLPARWLPDPNAMTVFGALFRPWPRPPVRRERWHVTLVTTGLGGHVGFVSGSPLRPRFWAEARAVEFLASLGAGTRLATPPAGP
jgi:predicted alpha/beta-fold hydrolase